MQKKKGMARVAHDEEVGRRLTSARDASKLNRTEAAALVGLTAENVRRIEAGMVSLGGHLALQFARLYRVSPSWLMWGEDEDFARPNQQAA